LGVNFLGLKREFFLKKIVVIFYKKIQPSIFAKRAFRRGTRYFLFFCKIIILTTHCRKMGKNNLGQQKHLSIGAKGKTAKKTVHCFPPKQKISRIYFGYQLYSDPAGRLWKKGKILCAVCLLKKVIWRAKIAKGNEIDGHQQLRK